LALSTAIKKDVMENIDNRIRQALAKVTGIPISMITSDFDLVESGVVDSIQILQLIDELEKEFFIRIMLEDFSEFTTLPKIIRAIASSMEQGERLGSASI
jgi:acyl carrier protein